MIYGRAGVPAAKTGVAESQRHGLVAALQDARVATRDVKRLKGSGHYARACTNPAPGSGAGALDLRFFRSRYAEFKRAIDILFALPGPARHRQPDRTESSPSSSSSPPAARPSIARSAWGWTAGPSRSLKLRTMVRNAEAKTGPVGATINDPCGNRVRTASAAARICHEAAQLGNAL